MDTRGHADTGSVLQSNQAAIVAMADGEMLLYLPDPEKSEWPDAFAALVAVYVRLQKDQDFFNDMVAWFDDQEKEDRH